MKRVNQVIDMSFKVFGAAALLLMISLVFYNAVLRYFFDATVPESEEIARFAFIWAVFMGAIITERQKAHIVVTILTERLHGIPSLIVRIVRELVVLGTLGFILYGSIRYTLHVTFLTPATNTPFWTIAISLSIAAAYLLLAKIVEIFLDIWRAITGKSLIKPSEETDKGNT